MLWIAQSTLTAMPLKPPPALYAALALLGLGGVYGIVWALTPYTAGKLVVSIVFAATVYALAYQLRRGGPQIVAITVMIGAAVVFAGPVQVVKNPAYGASLVAYGLAIVGLLRGPKSVREWARQAKAPDAGTK